MSEGLKIFIVVIVLLLLSGLFFNLISKHGEKEYSSESDTPYPESTDSVAINEALLSLADEKGFKRGVIENRINTKWSEFNDAPYYSYVKTLKSGMKLYRFESAEMMMEVYVLKGVIKIQSSSFLLRDKTSQIIREMDAWVMSCNPVTVNGDLSTIREYNFNDYDIILRDMGESIHYMISSKDYSLSEKKVKTDIQQKLFSNTYFSIKYPSSWQIVQDDNKVTNQTSIALQIMEKQQNDDDFRANKHY
jgi:hypothetical protein